LLTPPPTSTLFPYTTLFRSPSFLVVRVAVDEPVPDELRFDRRDGADHARVVGGQEADERNDEEARVEPLRAVRLGEGIQPDVERSEEHTSELQSRSDLVCRL